MRRRLFTLASVVGLLLCLATVAAWIRSTNDERFWYFPARGPHIGVEVWGGMELFFETPQSLRELSSDGDFCLRVGSFRLQRDTWHGGRSWAIGFPCWAASLLTFLTPASWMMLYLFCRASSKDGCATCRYDLTGNTSGVCPEGGTPIAASLRETA